MQYPNKGGQRRPSPQLPAFCRSRRPINTAVQVSTLQQLQWLLWLTVALQLSTLLLLLAGPIPPHLGPRPAPVMSPVATGRTTGSERSDGRTWPLDSLKSSQSQLARS